MRKRTRFFLACEGESEQSFVKWIQMLCEEHGVAVHLDAWVLGGGGLGAMLSRAVDLRERQQRLGRYAASFLLVDQDRANQGDCTIEALRKAARTKGFLLCVQEPNLEALLTLLIEGSKGVKKLRTPAAAEARLRKTWPDYEKPANAQQLRRKIPTTALPGTAEFARDLKILLERIGLFRALRRRQD